MKRPQLLKILLICFSFGFIACSSDDSDPTPAPPATEGNFTKRVLVEDYTSIWCGNCPRVAYAIDLLDLETEQMVAVGIHGPFSGKDDPFNFDFSALAAEFDIDGLPAAKLNRATTWTYPEADNLAQAQALTGENASIGLAINPVLEGANLNIDLKIKFGADFSSQNLKMVVYVLESDLIADQTNYSDVYGEVPTIPNYEYDHVLRASLTNLLGDAIPSGKTGLGAIYTQNLSVPVTETNVSDTANMHIVAFVIDGEGNVLNVRSANIGVTQNFEEH